MMIFILVCLISSLKSGTINQPRGFFNTIVSYGFAFSYFVLSKNLFNSDKKVKIFLFFAIGIGIYSSLMAILEHHGFYHLVFPPVSIGDIPTSAEGQISGILGGSAASGSLIAMTLLITIFLIIRRNTRFKLRYLLYVSIPLMLMAIFYTYERSAFLGLLIAILILGRFIRRLRKPLGLTFFLLTVIIALNWSNIKSSDRSVGGVGNPDNIYGRVVVMATSVNMFLDNPIFGSGLGSFYEKKDEYLTNVGSISYKLGEKWSQHNSILGILSELGLVGFIPYFLIFSLILIKSIRLFRVIPKQDGFNKELVIVFFGISTIYIVTASSIEVRAYEFLNIFFFTFAGIIVGLTKRIESVAKGM
jgi:O-antigen ligase